MVLKVLVPAMNSDKNSIISNHFGRAPYFALVELEDGKISNVEFTRNSHNHMHGHHLDLIELIVNRGVNVVIASHIGRRMLGELFRLGVKVFVGVNGSILENIDKFVKGELIEVNEDNLSRLTHHRHH